MFTACSIKIEGLAPRPLPAGLRTGHPPHPVDFVGLSVVCCLLPTILPTLLHRTMATSGVSHLRLRDGLKLLRWCENRAGERGRHPVPEPLNLLGLNATPLGLNACNTSV